MSGHWQGGGKNPGWAGPSGYKWMVGALPSNLLWSLNHLLSLLFPRWSGGRPRLLYSTPFLFIASSVLSNMSRMICHLHPMPSTDRPPRLWGSGLRLSIQTGGRITFVTEQVSCLFKPVNFFLIFSLWWNRHKICHFNHPYKFRTFHTFTVVCNTTSAHLQSLPAIPHWIHSHSSELGMS